MAEPGRITSSGAIQLLEGAVPGRNGTREQAQSSDPQGQILNRTEPDGVTTL